MNRIVIGVILIIVGIALASWGYSIYDSAGSQLGRAVNGDTPIQAWLGMIGGGICVVLGALRLI